MTDEDSSSRKELLSKQYTLEMWEQVDQTP